MAKPSDSQMAAMVLAMADGYVNPSSATHARRCRTSTGRLDATCRACVQRGWMRSISGARYALTEAGEALIPHVAAPTRVADDPRWAF
jgi:hypothetical protein